MKEIRKALWLLFVVLGGAITAQAQGNPGQPPSPPLLPSPVEAFRRLIATNDAGREQFLLGKSPEARRIIEAKLREYTSLSATERDAKLRELQLRWYTQQLTRMKPADRTPQLARISEPDRAIIAQRLGRFSILPPPLQQAVLTNPIALTMIGQNPLARSSTDPRSEQHVARLTEFVEMGRADRTKVMEKLTATEQEQMQKTLTTFANLSKEERLEALQGFRKFAELSDLERTAFLSTAARWRNMSEKDREFWRRIVTTLERSQSPPPMPTVLKSSPPGSLVVTN